MKKPDVTMEDFIKQAKVEGMEINPKFIEMTEVLLDAMNKSYNKGYEDGFAAGMSDDELRDALEVFPVGDGRYLIVEG